VFFFFFGSQIRFLYEFKWHSNQKSQDTHGKVGVNVNVWR